MSEERFVRESRTVKASHVLPPDTNNHNTLFGGKLMCHIDDVAALAAMKHARGPVVTASTDSVDFLRPIRVENEVSLEAFVTLSDVYGSICKYCRGRFDDGGASGLRDIVPYVHWPLATMEDRHRYRKSFRS